MLLTVEMERMIRDMCVELCERREMCFDLAAQCRRSVLELDVEDNRRTWKNGCMRSLSRVTSSVMSVFSS